MSKNPKMMVIKTSKFEELNNNFNKLAQVYFLHKQAIEILNQRVEALEQKVVKDE